MIVVDHLIYYQHNPHSHYKWAHLFDTENDLDELHTFAQKIGLKRQWFQDHPTLPHYDVTETKWRLAQRKGAKLLTTEELRDHLRKRIYELESARQTTDRQ